VTPGTWLVKGYTWEPTKNLWATRWGAVKVIASAEQAADAGPSLILLPDEASLVPGMEYAPPGCIDAPAGSTVTLEYGVVEGSLEPDWQVLEEDLEVTTGELALAFEVPSCVAGNVKLRATITDPSGASYVAYSPGNLTIVQDPADEKACRDSDEGCGCVAGGPAVPPAVPWLFALVIPCLRRRRREANLPS